MQKIKRKGKKKSNFPLILRVHIIQNQASCKNRHYAVQFTVCYKEVRVLSWEWCILYLSPVSVKLCIFSVFLFGTARASIVPMMNGSMLLKLIPPPHTTKDLSSAPSQVMHTLNKTMRCRSPLIKKRKRGKMSKKTQYYCSIKVTC